MRRCPRCKGHGHVLQPQCMGMKFVQCTECRGRGEVSYSASEQNIMLAKICLESLEAGKERRAANEMLKGLKQDPKVAEFVESWERARKLEEEGS